MSDEDDLLLMYGDKSYVSIATGGRMPTVRAPSVATVITAEDIKAIGATDLDEVLETVPGVHVSRAVITNAPVYVFRGMHHENNPQVLILLNGVPMNRLFKGNRGDVWGGFPVEHIARIEVIRGPGSALYGADAFAGVINIITKNARDIDGTQTGLRAGSFKTGDAWLLHGGQAGPVEIAGYLRLGTTDGAGRLIAADAQTGWDRAFNTDASLAPGRMNDNRNAIDAHLDLRLRNWRWWTALKERRDVGSGVGVAQALDPTGRSYSQNLTTSLGYHERGIVPDWDLDVQASFTRYREFSDLVLYPAGAFEGRFVDGFIGNPYKWERQGRLSASAFYNGFERHRVRVGAGYTAESIYRTREWRNYTPDFMPIGSGSRADVIEVTESAPFLRPQSRNIRYVYLQDEWDFAADWSLTAGVRHDRYSDFGSTTNPRAALVWHAAYNLTAKLLYGSAFRAPSFTELYAINNPVGRGNPGVQPERMRTIEAVLNWQARPDLQLGASVYQYRMSDMLRLVGIDFANAGSQTGRGLEIEATWDLARTLRVSGNAAYQEAFDPMTGANAGNAPRTKLYLRSDWRFMPGWLLNTQLNWVGTREREPGDTRAPLPGYRTVDFTLRTDLRSSPWELALSVRNVFNADVREPSPLTAPFVNLPFDIPLPGRSVFVQAVHRF
ncbi:MAG TPA: TonB-dependent receptor [Noviherbaspirillum sp.]|nr:TonB-dependent receptor [Noviherbaspirillum sp.]